MSPKDNGVKDNLKTGGEILVESLRVNGVDKVFCVPGESYLAALDAFHDVPEIQLVVCRQESGAAMMADAHARLTGRPGICFVTRGPGATNASGGIHIAMQDSTPLILLIGQIARDHTEREAFQEVDYRRMFGPLSKWVGQIDDETRVAEYVSHAFHRAQAGRPGPVVLALPEDMLRARTAPVELSPAVEVQAHPGEADMERLRGLLEKAERPLAILGGGGWNDQACQDFQAFAEANEIPTCVTFRCQDRLDNTHPSYCGDLGVGQNPKLQARVRDADLLVVIGTRLGEMSTGGYTLIDIPKPKQTMVHVHQGAEELGWVYQPDLAINAGLKNFAAALKSMTPVKASWSAWTKTARDDYLTWTRPPEIPGDVQMAPIMDWLNENLEPDTIVCNGAGNFSSWANRFYRYRGYGTILAPTSGTMGFGLPAAVAAKLTYPDRTVVAFTGDGDFLMTGQEFGTAVQHGANIIILVGNNSMYGTIRMHQERDYPGRISGTELVNPDFAAYAESFGGFGAIVEKTEDFAPAFEAARQAGKPAVIEIRIDPDAVSPMATLSGLRQAAFDKAKG
ncbi:MAG: thiamine pyrophosphate-binding protein [Rhodospirillales bacterium]|nr:thiamine pyrophosphate-binding protein [Alphaproteobacteria bacterium]MBL6948655.1 thiamine pyrophosphate-binding protein [Rhodospirillales bacterium]